MLQQAKWYTTYLDIREKYPDPVSYKESHIDNVYCVLIAVRDYLGEKDLLNPPILQTLNPQLSYKDAMHRGADIIRANNNKDFDKAWDLLAEAMSS